MAEKFCGKCVEKLVGRVGLGNWAKGVGENLVENCVEKVVGKIRMKNSVDKFSRKFVVNNCIEQ